MLANLNFFIIEYKTFFFGNEKKFSQYDKVLKLNDCSRNYVIKILGEAE